MPNKNDNNNSKRFNAREHAREFEKLSLEVVNIIFKESLDEKDIIHKDITQETKDKGVDAYLVLNIRNTNMKCTYTVESKLRTGRTLSLKDFATSILYYLINTSSRHYIVTNITYSAETLKYIEQFNTNKEKFVELVDGRLLQEIINTRLSELYKYHEYSKELIDYLVNRSFPRKNYIPQTPKPDSFEQIIKITSYENNIQRAIREMEIGCCNFMVTGEKGTGKSSLLKMLMKELDSKYTIHKFDISVIQTPKLFVIEILRILLRIDIDSLFSDLAVESDAIEEIFAQFQTYNSMPVDIINSTKTLVSNDTYKQEEYIYSLNVLIKHLYQNFLLQTNTVLIIENLHEASSMMIQFVINTANYICQEKVLFFWELLIPTNPKLLPNVSIEQWFGYLQLLESHKYNGNVSYNIKLGPLKDFDLNEIITQFLPGVTFTSNFIDNFTNNFGMIPQDVFNALQLVKKTKAYSTSTLNQIANRDSFSNEDYILTLTEKPNVLSDFFMHAFTFTWLLNGRLKSSVVEYLNKHYKLCTQRKLLETGFFMESNHDIIFQNQYLHILEQTIDLVFKKNCAQWLLDHIDELQLNHIEKKYYNSFFQLLISPDLVIEEIDDAIQYLNDQHVYKYVLSLAKIRYEYYQTQQRSFLYYKYFIAYIAYMQKSGMHDKHSFELLLNKADLLQAETMLLQANNDQYNTVNIEYAFIKYRWAKLNYNYDECEHQIEYILTHENKIENSEIFALARIYSALIKKERGMRKEFIVELVRTLQKYPDNLDVKASYYVNLAAMYKFDAVNNGMEISIKLLKTAQKLTYNHKSGRGDLEVEIGLLHLLCYNNQINSVHIQSIRLMAEKAGSMQYLAKTFNLEAYYHFKRGDTNATIECLNSAVYHSLASGQSKQYFLFGLNLLTVMIDKKLTESSEFNNFFFNIFQWFKKNQNAILNRLNTNPYFRRDHMYAAFISLMCAIIRTSHENMIKETAIFQYYPEWKTEECLNTQMLLENIPRYYKCDENIFILF